MGKKQKVGKARKDKFYHLAKETGYRARSAFKLIQLNRKFGFLENSRVCIDLCAAPGGWCQVAAKFMPVSSLIIGVDLAPIKPIPNVTTFIDDITTDSCRSKLKKQMQTWKADCVLNDGAPNVGQAWAQDAFIQAQLTLSAFKLAAEFLKEGGTFVTKIFRSKDYQALLWVFQQFFKKVMATKPQASRNESAEIFVVCQHFLAPDKIDPKFFSYKSVFADVAKETNNQKLNLIHPAKITRKREGYSDDASLSLYKSISARLFIDSEDHLELLSTAYTIELKEEKLLNSIHTTDEVKESLKDIKVLGKKEIKGIIKWREKIVKDENPEEDVEMEEEVEEEEDEETKIEHQIVELQTAENTLKRQKKKKTSKLKEKNLAKVAKGLDLSKEAFGVDEDPNLFNLQSIKSKKSLENVETTEVQAEDPIEEQQEEEEEEEEEEGSEEEEEDSDADDEGEGVDIDSATDEEDEVEEKEEEKEDNPLLVKEKRDKIDKTNLWFSKLKDKLLEEDIDEDLEVDAMASAFGVGKDKVKKDEAEKDKVEEDTVEKSTPDSDTKKVTFDLPKEEKTESKKGTPKPKDDNEDSETDSESESDDEDYRGLRDKKRKEPASKTTDDIEVVPAQKRQKALTAAELALGQQMVTSRKKKNEIMDSGYHRWAWGEEDLPEWFVDEEKKYYQKSLPVTKEQVAEYKQQIKEINARPIKKIAEAKAKAKFKAMRKLKKLAEQADLITDNSHGAQAEQILKLRQMVKKVDLSKKKEETTYVKANRAHGKYQRRPANAKGKIKFVDSRMKKDVDGMKRAAAKKKGGTSKKIKNRVGHKPRSR